MQNIFRKNRDIFKLLGFLLIIISIYSCDKFLGDDDSLSLKREECKSNKLKLNGYYYCIAYDLDICYVNLFYKNGVMINVGGEENSLDNMDSYINKHYVKDDDYKQIRYHWGVFLIKEDSIFFEHWYPSERPHKAYVKSGLILNDTSFLINKCYKLKNGLETEIEERNELYYFRHLNIKPDSINKYVNN